MELLTEDKLVFQYSGILKTDEIIFQQTANTVESSEWFTFLSVFETVSPVAQLASNSLRSQGGP